ncbi:DUF4132 domain-containing protein [Clostridiaceae bacterium]|nr:DUF4132 domain-containing protein [Clostridiaceae bacterium]RKI15583.1 DUF4132 domain-containing protein [bacterium 1XD21-70]
MAEFNWNSRNEITKSRMKALEGRIGKLSGEEKELALQMKNGQTAGSEIIGRIAREYEADPKKKPSEWFRPVNASPSLFRIGKPSALAVSRQKFLDAFVPEKFQPSCLAIADKLNRFPFTRGWMRRTVRTASYGPHIFSLFSLLLTYEKLFYCGERLEDVILRRMDGEKLDYIHNNYYFYADFSYLYAAEIDRGNQAVIEALKEVILSENNTAYLDRQMILGIIRSDNEELQELLCRLLLAARLQEGLRQAICESMDEGTAEAFLKLLQVIEEHGLIRFSSVKRAVSTWIGIFDAEQADRVNGKMLTLMGRCLREKDYCRELLGTNDSIAISAALWAQGFYEAEDAVRSMERLVDEGTKNQRLTASFYNNSLYDEKIRIRVAKKVILEHAGDVELTAAFLPAFAERTMRLIRKAMKERVYDSDLREPQAMDVEECFGSRQEAEQLYGCFHKLHGQLPKKGVVYDPCIFPWYRVELTPADVVNELAFLAYVLRDEEKVTETAALLGEAESGLRAMLFNLLLYRPSNGRQRELAIGYVGNADTKTSLKAVQVVKKLSLKDQEYRMVEDMLRFKRSSLRGTLIGLLMEQPEEKMEGSLRRLLQDKREEKRSAGLDILLRLSKEEKQAGLYNQVKGLAALVENPTDKESVLLQELGGQSGETAAEKKGYGIYDPDVPDVLLEPGPEEKPKTPAQMMAECMPLTVKEALEKLKKLDGLVRANKDYEYAAANGERTLLGNAYSSLEGKRDIHRPYWDRKLDDYPLAEVFGRFYEEEIRDYRVLVELEILLNQKSAGAYQAAKPFYQKIFGGLPFEPQGIGLEYGRQVQEIMAVYHWHFSGREALMETGISLALAMEAVVNRENKVIRYTYVGWNGRMTETTASIGSMPFFSQYLSGLSLWQKEDPGEDGRSVPDGFWRAFAAAWKLEVKCQEDRMRRRFLFGGGIGREATMTGICPYWFLKAYQGGMIAEDTLYKAVMEYFAREDCLRMLCEVKRGEGVKTQNRKFLDAFFGWKMTNRLFAQGEGALGEDTWLGQLMCRMYDRIVPQLVDTELRRGEAETEFSWDMRGVSYISGTNYLVRILMALGKDTLSRDAYYSYYYSGNTRSKKDVLSSLLKACYPQKGETGEDLRAALKGTHIKEPRLVEVAMYAPQWIDVIQGYLGWQGLKSGCYYFMAHMNEYFDDQKKAIIARYTPLTPEELQNGAFDVAWFEEAYGLLGEKNFGLLYNAAKYISSGTAHSRARKYADAATGKVSLEMLCKEITAKRNKDLLMSYGLVPLGEDREKDLLERYQYIQQYQKESRQFGAQRRASEAKAAELALVNLSVRAGFGDVTRLVLNMESRMVEAYAPLMEWTAVEDAKIRLHVGEDGKSQVLCRKGGKELKSVPSRLAKKPYVLEVKEAHKKLKDQYVRTRAMMEEAMEHGTVFMAAEVAKLFSNPVVQSVLEPLVFVQGEYVDGGPSPFVAGFAGVRGSGTAGQEGISLILSSWDGQKEELPPDGKLRIAHPLDLWRSGQWHEYQRYLFSHGIRQPFKQVFRELYVKLPEEAGQKYSRMFAGNQIQPGKTVGCLRGRRWVADYEEGLQKIYYKENIVARIYALADWFSPSDVEAPTLEWVEFSDRKTFQALTMDQVPGLIYSEVMRDVDLAVSVAHAGGVDPEASHSTIEMRRAIVEFNLPLFGLKNVTLSGSHAHIQGSRASYNVHLGSGSVHMEGGKMLMILPVHSQKRGKLFLPFVDEDPKTAEIMAKIVFLAEDKKIKDPSVLRQILG